MLRTFIVYGAIVPLVFVVRNIEAEEPVERFLTALQERGHFDVALRYLDRMSTSQLVTAEFKNEIPYRRGMLLVSSARATRNAALRKTSLNAARKAFEEYVSSNARGSTSALARNQLSNILVEQARALMDGSKGDDPNRARLAREAAEIYGRAHEALSASRVELGNEYKALVGKRDPESKKKLTSLMAQYVETNWLAARVLFEHAEAVKDEPKQYQDKLEQAAGAFEEVAQKYRSYTAGVHALLYEGQCYQLLGDHKRAITYFKELMQHEANSSAMRLLKTRALARRIDSLLASDGSEGPSRSIAMATEWLKTARGDEDRTPAWMDLRLSLAKAYQQKASVEPKAGLASRALSEARSIAGEVARRQHPLQQEAQKLLVALGRGNTKEVSVNASTAKTFEEAQAAAMEALQSIKLAGGTISILSSQLASIKDPARRSEIEERLEQAREQSAAGSQLALDLFKRTAELATDEHVEELNGVRYYLAYLYYSLGQYRRAAVLAGFVALEYPSSVAAKECAGVALAARQRLYRNATDNERNLQAAQIAKIAQLMVSKWPEDPQAGTALVTLVDVSLQRGEIDKAEEHLKRIPADSPKRVNAELRIGQSLWREYLRRLAAKQSGQPLNESDLAEYRSKAREILSISIERLGDAPGDDLSIRAALSLAQIYVESGSSEEALAILQHEQIGALALTEEGSPWLQRIPGLATEAYKTAIRAHVASAVASGDTESSITAAQDMLRQLQGELKSQLDGKQKMITIYVGLARDLERQLAVASEQDRRALSKGFESFLRGAADGSRDISVLNWVAETFYSLGRGMLRGQKSSPEAQRYFTEAAAAYGEVLLLAKSQPGALSENAFTQVKVRRAMSLRQLGKYRDSVDLFANVLSERNTVLNIQIEAAKTLQQWGSSGNAEGYQKAIAGDRRGADGKNAIWGWGRIAKLVAKNEAYRDTFHEARYNIALSRYHYAMASSNDRQRALLDRAKSDIIMTRKLFGSGSRAQSQRYEALLRTVQKSLGEPVTGFSEPT